MKYLMKNKLIRKWQAAAAVLLFVFIAGVSQAGFKEDLAAGKTLQQVIESSLIAGIPVKSLMADLLAAEIGGKDIICGFFDVGAAKYEVIAAALDNGIDPFYVELWSTQCGAMPKDMQVGFSMAGGSLPPGIIFQQSNELEYSDKTFLYIPPSPSQ